MLPKQTKAVRFIALATLITVANGDLETTRLLVRSWLAVFLFTSFSKLTGQQLIGLALRFDPTEGYLNWQAVRDKYRKTPYHIIEGGVVGAECHVILAALLLWPGHFILSTTGFPQCLGRSSMAWMVFAVLVNVYAVIITFHAQARIWYAWRKLPQKQLSPAHLRKLEKILLRGGTGENIFQAEMARKDRNDRGSDVVKAGDS